MMVKAFIAIAIAFVLMHWLSSGQDDIIKPEPVFPSTSVEATP